MTEHRREGQMERLTRFAEPLRWAGFSAIMLGGCLLILCGLLGLVLALGWLFETIGLLATASILTAAGFGLFYLGEWIRPYKTTADSDAGAKR